MLYALSLLSYPGLCPTTLPLSSAGGTVEGLGEGPGGALVVGEGEVEGLVVA